ncbi:hypothetical protein [Haloarchaeobius sp. HME9146]|uniref:hypothetical protein n=1 Tax=Haloarchaeobius sp. HME9146 TaxID=2978732 RepID=UPI0021C12A1F|nr:hypothetical protein [Haloarchaeobius sp. HME9146]MCT9096631.1 hypothetical protein [Haloarchaeobius sp. HME9146]
MDLRRVVGWPLVTAVVAAACFFLGIRLLSTATGVLAPGIEPVLGRAIRGDLSAVGTSWLVSYAVLNGSVVAAVSVTLTHSGLLGVSELFAAIVGSRLGASGVVIVLGVFEYVQKESYSLRDATSLGVLSAIVTFALFVPVTAGGLLGYWLGDPTAAFVGAVPSFGIGQDGPVTTAVEALVALLGPHLGALVAVALLFGSFRLFDRALSAVETDRFREAVVPLARRPWATMLVGFVLTSVTTSVAFSVGVFVPLYNRDFFERDELVPYLLGANVGTMSDTLLVAVVLDSAVGVVTVVLVMATTGLLVVLFVATGGRFTSLVEAADERVRGDPRTYAWFVAGLVLLPVLLVLVG